METFRDYIKNKINKNHLPLDVDETFKIVNYFKEHNLYKDYTDYQLLYQYILNLAGSIIANIDMSTAECFGYLKPKVSYKKEVIYYEFFTEPDYYDWLNSRKEIYANVNSYDDLRILNFVEMCTMNFITDINTESKYEIYNNCLKKIDTIIKTKFGVDKSNLSFIKYLASEFYKENVYKHI